MASAASALAGFATSNGIETRSLQIDQRLASLWFGWSLKPLQWQVPAAWDEFAGDYQTRDGWIKLHTNAPHHKAAALTVLEQPANRKVLATAVAAWSAEDLEQAIVEAGGCAAALRTQRQWREHPQGRAVNRAPLIHWQPVANCQPHRTQGVNPAHPLSDFRILDLTRVLAGPVASRFLAGYGAEVLRIDPPHWTEPGVVPEVTLGKRCAGLDLTKNDDRQRFEALLANADLLLHGYRANALDKLGYDRASLSKINSQLIDVSLNAYGWKGPWRERRGFDSLVQMSSGIAAHGMAMSGTQRPSALPVQALDHATGYLLAAAALQALSARQRGKVMSAKTSLAGMAGLLQTTRREHSGSGFAAETPADRATQIEETAWGAAQRLRWPIHLSTASGALQPAWAYPAGELRSSPAQWRQRV